MFYLIFKSPIRFAQGWEDHRVVEEGLKIKKGDVLACILASGDNVLNLLRFKPEKIYFFGDRKEKREGLFSWSRAGGCWSGHD